MVTGKKGAPKIRFLSSSHHYHSSRGLLVSGHAQQGFNFFCDSVDATGVTLTFTSPIATTHARLPVGELHPGCQIVLVHVAEVSGKKTAERYITRCDYAYTEDKSFNLLGRGRGRRKPEPETQQTSKRVLSRKQEPLSKMKEMYLIQTSIQSCNAAV